MKTPSGEFLSWILQTGNWKKGLYVSAQIPIPNVLNVSLPNPVMEEFGNYIFYIAIDPNSDGLVDAAHGKNEFIYDYVVVEKIKECSFEDTDTVSCTIENGSGFKTRSCSTDNLWSNFGSCDISDCNTGYIQSGNQCISDKFHWSGSMNLTKNESPITHWSGNTECSRLLFRSSWGISSNISFRNIDESANVKNTFIIGGNITNSACSGYTSEISTEIGNTFILPYPPVSG